MVLLVVTVVILLAIIAATWASTINVPNLGRQRLGSVVYGVGSFSVVSGNYTLGLFTGTSASTGTATYTLSTLLALNAKIAYTGYASQPLAGVTTTGVPD